MILLRLRLLRLADITDIHCIHLFDVNAMARDTAGRCSLTDKTWGFPGIRHVHLLLIVNFIRLLCIHFAYGMSQIYDRFRLYVNFSHDISEIIVHFATDILLFTWLSQTSHSEF